MFGLSDHTITLLQNYFRQKKDIRQVRVYGSRAIGTEEKGSDIDLVIYSDVKRDLTRHVKTELENLSTPYIFDVVDYTYIQHAGLKKHIDSISKPLFEKARLKELAAIPDSEIDTSEKPVSLRVDREVLEWFKKRGSGYQSSMNAVLKAYMEAHKNL